MNIAHEMDPNQAIGCSQRSQQSWIILRWSQQSWWSSYHGHSSDEFCDEQCTWDGTRQPVLIIVTTKMRAMEIPEGIIRFGWTVNQLSGLTLQERWHYSRVEIGQGMDSKPVLQMTLAVHQLRNLVCNCSCATRTFQTSFSSTTIYEITTSFVLIWNVGFLGIRYQIWCNHALINILERKVIAVNKM